jgi:ribosomal protein L7/L12
VDSNRDQETDVLKVFKCPTCGAPLTYEGGAEATVKCQYCGNTVVVPEELREADTAPPIAEPAASRAARLEFPLDKAQEISDLVRAGNKIEAIKLYRELTGAGLAESKDAIERFAAGEPLQITRTTVTTQGARLGQIAPERLAEVLRLTQSGNKIEAIKLFREMTGLGLKEAKDAVEAIQAGQTWEAQATFVASTRQTPVGDPLPSSKMAQITQLARAGQKIEAIKLYREVFGVGLKEAKEVVDKIAPDRRARAQSGGCVSVLTGLGGVLLCIVLAATLPLRLSGSYPQALNAARNSPDVQAALGTPVEEEWWWPVTGQIRCSGGCGANYTFWIRGPKGEAKVWVTSDSEGGFMGFGGVWELDAWVYVNDQVVATLEPPPPTPTPRPTLTLAEADATAGAEARATREAGATATAERQQVLDLTATVEAQAAADVEATQQALASAQSMVAAQAGWQTTVIAEAFGNNANGWPTERLDDGSLVLIPAVTDGVYGWTIQPASGGHYFNILPGAVRPVDDFVVSVDARLASGGQGGVYVYGLAFRAEGSDYGFFGLTNEGSVRIYGVYGTAIYQFYDFDSEAVNPGPGATNRLTVRALGPDFVFQINDQVVFTWNQPDLNDGRVGLGVDIGREGADAVIEFDNFEVRTP